MSDYQVIARKFRPKCFSEVVGQDAIVVTLKNAIQSKRLAQAYLFCGSHGTGKTTLARILAKALNCDQLSANFEPCTTCSSCREIAAGNSLDVIEIDGASNRGIEDIRQINDNVGYAAASGKYKIYLIDEVHMLTKEAFNALLKTLEEPPPKVLFFFATTEAHKLPATILSRCQRFNLKRIPVHQIVQKLNHIATNLGVSADAEALQLLAQHAEGGLRDAESLFDQILSFTDGKVTVEAIQSILGLMPKSAYFELDQAGASGNFTKAFEIAQNVFAEGKELAHFMEGLIVHFRTILLMQLGEGAASLLDLSASDRERYGVAARQYGREQCLDLIDYLIDAQDKIRYALSPRIALEGVLLHILRSHFRIPVEQLVQKLGELEQQIQGAPAVEAPMQRPVASPPPAPPPQIIPAPLPSQPKAALSADLSHSIDPVPTPQDFGKKAVAQVIPAAPPMPAAPAIPPVPLTPPTPVAKPAPPPPPPTAPIPSELVHPTHRYDTIFQFAAVELEGKLQRH